MVSGAVFLFKEGLLGTGAPFRADLNLIVQLVMGSVLIAGAYLARRKRYKAHGICQTTVLLLNLLMIGLVMWPSFQEQVKPALSVVGGRVFGNRKQRAGHAKQWQAFQRRCCPPAVRSGR